MNYKTLLNDPKWAAKEWTPYVKKSASRKDNPHKCECSGAIQEMAFIKGGWTCKTCHAIQQFNSTQLTHGGHIVTKCGVSDNVHWWSDQLEGLGTYSQEGAFRESAI